MTISAYPTMSGWANDGGVWSMRTSGAQSTVRMRDGCRPFSKAVPYVAHGSPSSDVTRKLRISDVPPRPGDEDGGGGEREAETDSGQGVGRPVGAEHHARRGDEQDDDERRRPHQPPRRRPEALRERSEEHTSELQSQSNLVCRLLLEKKKKQRITTSSINRLFKHLPSVTFRYPLSRASLIISLYIHYF